MSNNQAGQQAQPTAYQQAEAVFAKGIAEATTRVQMAIDGAQRAALQKKAKQQKAEMEAEDEAGEIRFGIGYHQAPPEHEAGAEPEELTFEEKEKQAKDDILKQIEKHKEAVGDTHFDAGKEVVEVNPEAGSDVYGGRIIGVNDQFVALSHGRKIEIHKIADLKPNMMYDGRDVWRKPSDILTLGNTIDIKYRDGKAAVANVQEQQQEKQQERVLQKGISR